MKPSKPTRASAMGQWLAIVCALAVGVVLLAPSAFAGGLGRLIADLWVTVMSAVAGLLGGVFGG